MDAVTRKGLEEAEFLWAGSMLNFVDDRFSGSDLVHGDQMRLDWVGQEERKEFKGIMTVGGFAFLVLL